MHIPTTLIINDEIFLKILHESDAEKLFTLTIQNKEYLQSYLPWSKYIHNVSDTATFITLMQDAAQKDKEYCYGVWFQDVLVGTVSLRTGYNKCELGYWLAQNKQGKGIISKSIQFLLSTLQEKKIYPFCYIYISCKNEKSNNLAQRIGFTKIGILQHGEKINDIWYDQVVYVKRLYQE